LQVFFQLMMMRKMILKLMMMMCHWGYLHSSTVNSLLFDARKNISQCIWGWA
jgi:hypothetical protein